MAEVSTIRDLLNKLAKEHINVSWKMKCSYADGLGKSYHEIHLFWHDTQLRKTITFQMETGEVLRNACGNISVLEAQDIIDLLLDLLNEKTNVLPKI